MKIFVFHLILLLCESLTSFIIKHLIWPSTIRIRAMLKCIIDCCFFQTNKIFFFYSWKIILLYFPDLFVMFRIWSPFKLFWTLSSGHHCWTFNWFFLIFHFLCSLLSYWRCIACLRYIWICSLSLFCCGFVLFFISATIFFELWVDFFILFKISY